jgi:hypothetical protein
MQEIEALIGIDPLHLSRFFVLLQGMQEGSEIVTPVGTIVKTGAGSFQYRAEDLSMIEDFIYARNSDPLLQDKV